jgi:hypothetical protein
MYRFFRFKMRKADTLMGNMKDLQSAYAAAQKATKNVLTPQQKEIAALKAKLQELEAGSAVVAAPAKTTRRVKATAK